jgi:hypothetical protein
MKRVVVALIVLLTILHQDFWWWDDHETLVAGFVPITLAYHMGISLGAGILWACAVRWCWPAGVDDADPSTAAPSAAEGGRA